MNVELLYKIIRFCIVGGLASIVYLIVAHGLLAFSNLAQVPSSFIAYLIAIPFSFLGQKYFTFKAKGDVKIEVVLFAITHFLGLITSTVVVFLAQALSFSASISFLIVVILVPVVNFALMNNIIFRPQISKEKTT